MDTSYKLAIIGPKEAVMGFKMLGIEIFSPKDTKELVINLYSLKKETINEKGHERNAYAIIFVTEQLAEKIPQDDYKKLTNDALPAIIPIPSHLGSTGFGISRLSKIVERAIGSNILK